MIENMIIFTLTVIILSWFLKLVIALLDKWGIFGYLEHLGSQGDSKLFYDLVNCRLCLVFHFSWMVSMVFAVCIWQSWLMILVPFCVTGQIVKTK